MEKTLTADHISWDLLINSSKAYEASQFLYDGEKVIHVGVAKEKLNHLNLVNRTRTIALTTGGRLLILHKPDKTVDKVRNRQRSTSVGNGYDKDDSEEEDNDFKFNSSRKSFTATLGRKMTIQSKMIKDTLKDSSLNSKSSMSIKANAVSTMKRARSSSRGSTSTTYEDVDSPIKEVDNENDFVVPTPNTRSWIMQLADNVFISHVGRPNGLYY